MQLDMLTTPDIRQRYFGRTSPNKCAVPEIVECRRIACQNAGHCIRLGAQRQHNIKDWLCMAGNSVWRRLGFVLGTFVLATATNAGEPRPCRARVGMGAKPEPTNAELPMIDTAGGQTPRKPFRYMLVGLVMAAALAAALALLVPTKARAQGIQLYGGVQAGYSIANTEVSSPLAPGFSIDGLGSKGMIGGVHGGVDMQMPSSIWFVGVFGDYTWQRVDFSINPVATARLGDSWTIGGRAGFVSGKSKYYGLLGYTQAESSLNIAGVTMPTFKGLTYGAGVSYALANNLALGLEARYTHFDSANVMNVVDLQPDQLSVMARLSFQFGGMSTPANVPLK